MAALIIENVDLELLEEQRKVLNKFLLDTLLPDDVRDAIEGIEAMLDHWSDEQYSKINSVL